MLQIIINLDHVDVLYLISFIYSYGLVKARQLFIEGLYNLIGKIKETYLKYSGGTNKTKLCYYCCYFYL